MGIRKDDPRACPGSGRLGDWRNCPVCGLGVSPPRRHRICTVPTHIDRRPQAPSGEHDPAPIDTTTTPAQEQA